MSFPTTVLSAFSLAAALAALSPPLMAEAEPKVRTKIVVEADAARSVKHDTSVYLVYPTGPALEALVDAGVPDILEPALERKGYLIVSDPDQASVFLKIDFIEGEPFRSSITLVERGAFDYSNAASTRNYATVMPGGRYHSLGDPRRQSETGATGFVLGPDGAPIDVGRQAPTEAAYDEGEQTTLDITVYPVVLELSAWRFETPESDPSRVWRVAAIHQSIEDEPVETQLDDLAEAAVKQIGKRLKKPKVLSRKLD